MLQLGKQAAEPDQKPAHLFLNPRLFPLPVTLGDG